MPPKINIQKCDGCLGIAEPLCMRICPGDLLFVDDTGKAGCRKTRDCWDCMSCVKICPQEAISLKLPYQLGYYPAQLIPKVGADHITWICVDLHGKVERFTMRTRNKRDEANDTEN